MMSEKDSMRSGKNKKKRILKAGHIFLAYFVVITLILLWSLFHCTEYSWPTVNLFPVDGRESSAKPDPSGSTETVQEVELKDDAPLFLRALAEQEEGEEITERIGKKPRLRGVALLGYKNSRSLKYSEETVTAQIVNTSTGEVVGSGTLPLRNQTPFSNEETAVYVTLSEPVTQMLPEELEVRFTASGLTRNGIFLSGGTAAEGQDVPFARLYYEKKKWAPLRPFLYFLLEFIAGIGCLILYSKSRMPLLRSGRKQYQKLPDDLPSSGSGSGKSAAGKGALQRAGQLAVPALVLLFILAMLLFTYVHVIKTVAAACTGELLTGGSRTAEVIALEPGTVLRQSLQPGKNSLTGIGIALAEEDGDPVLSPEKMPYAASMLEWKLLDESGTAVLTSGSGQVKDLKKVSTLLGNDIKDKNILAKSQESYLLSLDQPVPESKGKEFVLEIAVPEQAGTQESVCLLATGETNGQIELTAADASAASLSGKETLPLELDLMGTYRCNGSIKGMYLRISVIVLVMLAGLYYAARRFSDSGAGLADSGKTASMYLVSALCMGMVFSFLTPAYTVPDERTHIDSVYILSNQLLGIKEIPGPKRLFKRACDVDTSIANTMPMTAERYTVVYDNLFEAAPKMVPASEGEASNKGGEEAWEDAVDVRMTSARELIPAYTRSAIDNVPLLCYLPSAIGFTAARLLGRNMITMVMMARWLNLLVSVWIIYLAIRRMPYGAAAMAVIGLFPKTMQEMSSCSYDGMVIAGTFLFIALTLTAAFDNRVCITDLLALFLSGLYVASCKGGVYLPVLGLVMIVPWARAGRGKKIQIRWLAVSSAVAGGAALLFIGKYIVRISGMFGRKSGTASIGAGAKKLYTLSDFVHAPFKLVRIYLNTILKRGPGMVGELVGKNLCQRWYFVLAFLLLAFLGILRKKAGRQERNEYQDHNHVGLRARIWILILTALSVSLVFMSMLLAFTGKDAAFIEGLQGRYFLPIAPLPLLAVENGLVHRKYIGDTAILYTADLLLAVTICEILLTYLG